MNNQQSNKRGKRSTAQKEDSSRHGFAPIPATSKVSGSSGGNRLRGRMATDVLDHYAAEQMSDRGEALRNSDAKSRSEGQGK